MTIYRRQELQRLVLVESRGGFVEIIELGRITLHKSFYLSLLSPGFIKEYTMLRSCDQGAQHVSEEPRQYGRGLRMAARRNHAAHAAILIERGADILNYTNSAEMTMQDMQGCMADLTESST